MASKSGEESGNCTKKSQDGAPTDEEFSDPPPDTANTWVPCQVCTTPYKKQNYEQHRHETPKQGLNCRTCMAKFNSCFELDRHQRMCGKCLTTAGKCFYYDLCLFETNILEDLQDHMQTAMPQHLEAVTMMLEEKTYKIQERRNRKLMELSREVNKQFDDLNCKMEATKRDLAAGERRFEQPFPNLNSVIKSTELIEKNDVSLAPLKSRADRLKEWMIDNTKTLPTLGDLTQSVEENMMRIRNLKYESEAATYPVTDGKLVWKITSYGIRKSNALRETHKYIESRPFYTDPYGYKMCARVYFDGGDPEEGGELGLYFFIMKGDYDDILDWPFSQKVTIGLLSQKSAANNKMVTIKPDPRTGCYGQPEEEANGLVGVSNLANFEKEVETDEYLVDNTIFVLVNVSKKRLKHEENPGLLNSLGYYRSSDAQIEQVSSGISGSSSS